jgi:hypothetical protein
MTDHLRVPPPRDPHKEFIEHAALRLLHAPCCPRSPRPRLDHVRRLEVGEDRLIDTQTPFRGMSPGTFSGNNEFASLGIPSKSLGRVISMNRHHAHVKTFLLLVVVVLAALALALVLATGNPAGAAATGWTWDDGAALSADG